MTNTFAPFGFSQTGNAEGTAPNFALTTRKILYSDTTKIFTGDPVKMGNGGYVAQWTVGTAVSQLAGIFVGCEYLSTAQGRVIWSPYWPGADTTTDATAYIIPASPGSFPTFVVQTANSNTTASACTIADIGQNIDVALGSGSTVNGRSTAYADLYTMNTTATLPFRITGLYPGVGNGSDATSAYNWVIVQANVAGTTGI